MHIMQKYESYEKTKQIYTQLQQYIQKIKTEINNYTNQILNITLINITDAINAKSDTERKEQLNKSIQNLNEIRLYIPNKHKQEFNKIKKEIRFLT